MGHLNSNQSDYWARILGQPWHDAERDVFGRTLSADERGKLSRWGEQERNPEATLILGSGDPSRAPDWVTDPTKTVEVTRSEGDSINAGTVDAEVVASDTTEQTSPDSPGSDRSSGSGSGMGTTSSSGRSQTAVVGLLALAVVIGYVAVGGGE